MIRYGSLIILFLLLTACEKNIQVQPEQQAPKLVVEAQIENGQAPVVVLSNSVDYFSSIDTATLNNSYVHGAKLTISDGQKSVVLKENSVAMGGGYYLYYYSTDQTTPQNTFLGDLGRKYDLTIETGGQQYLATTTIPQVARKIDSIWWKAAPNNPDTGKTVVMARVSDPPGYGNYIRYFTSVNNKDFYPGINSVSDDQIIDGTTYDVQIYQGVPKTAKLKFEDYGYFRKGDTVIVKLCNIDKASYDFWRTWEFTYQSVGNPFSSPGKVLGNISNNALGSFCGYAAQYKRLIIPK